MLNYYLDLLNIKELPEFIEKYLQTPSLLRLKKIGYFCGMDYASKEIYDFSEYITRYDHSLSVALLTYKLTKDKTSTIAGLFHDIATPCFSHVIDYMNKDYESQESTEELTEVILSNDKYLLKCLKEDNIKLEDISNFKKHSIVDNNRPKVCADRIDGVILTSIGWTKNITKKNIKDIVEDMYIDINEDKEQEISFKTEKVVDKVVEISNSIDIFCHSKEDNYMMELLAKITKYIIDKNIIKYEDLYYKTEEEIFNIIEKQKDKVLQKLIKEFKTKKLIDIPYIELPNIKVRDLKPLLNGQRKK